MNYTFSNDDLDILKTFVEEWIECMNGLEKEVLKLELESEDVDTIHDIFRRIHNIKGGSSFMGISCITALAHEAESAFDGIRKGELQVNSQVIDALLESVDLISNFVFQFQRKLSQNDFAQNEKEVVISCANFEKSEGVVKNLKKAIEASLLDKNKEETLSANREEEDNLLNLMQSEEFKNRLAESMMEQFMIETTEHLEKIEQELLIKLEKDESEKESMNEMFRVVHTIKGGTGILLGTLPPEGSIHNVVKDLSSIVHNFETLLAIVRDKIMKFDKSLVDLTYQFIDDIRMRLNFLSNQEVELKNPEILLKNLNEYVKVYSQANSQDISPCEEGNPVAKALDVTGQAQTIQSIRVRQDKIDKMMNMISELLIAKNSFIHLSRKINTDYNLPKLSKEVKEIGFSVHRISDELQDTIMSIRMVEIKTVFQKMPRIIRDVSQLLNKKIELIIEGESTEIDKSIVEQISDPLVHIIRNAADHGIEEPEIRAEKGKPKTGTIYLRAYNKNKHVYIEIEDDGKGIDAQYLKNKAVERGFIKAEEAEKMTKSQLVNLIFLPGFSTAQKVTEVSGRGVGMDIVKSNILKINGMIDIDSDVNKGTKMTIRLPLSLAISRGLLLETAGENYIIPLENIAETVKLDTKDIHDINGRAFIHLRNEVIGIAWLKNLLSLHQMNQLEEEKVNAVVVSNGTEKMAIIVDKLKNEQEFVIKTLNGHLAGIKGISGSTILGDGQIVLILNSADLFDIAESETKNEVGRKKNGMAKVLVT